MLEHVKIQILMKNHIFCLGKREIHSREIFVEVTFAKINLRENLFWAQIAKNNFREIFGKAQNYSGEMSEKKNREN